MMEISIVISLLLLLVGVLNYGNTMAARHTEPEADLCHHGKPWACLAGKIRKLLVREGMLYAFFFYRGYTDGRHADHLYMLSGCKLYRDTIFSSGAAPCYVAEC